MAKTKAKKKPVEDYTMTSIRFMILIIFHTLNNKSMYPVLRYLTLMTYSQHSTECAICSLLTYLPFFFIINALYEAHDSVSNSLFSTVIFLCNTFLLSISPSGPGSLTLSDFSWFVLDQDAPQSLTTTSNTAIVSFGLATPTITFNNC